MDKLSKVICMQVGVALLWAACKNDSGKSREALTYKNHHANKVQNDNKH